MNLKKLNKKILFKEALKIKELNSGLKASKEMQLF